MYVYVLIDTNLKKKKRVRHGVEAQGDLAGVIGQSSSPYTCSSEISLALCGYRDEREEGGKKP